MISCHVCEMPERYQCDGIIVAIHEDAGIPVATVRAYNTDVILPDKPLLDGRNGLVRTGDRVSVIRVGETYYAYRSLR